MMTDNKRYWLTALAALSLAACTADVLEPGTEVGQLELPLVSSASNGTQFMLEATFDLVGPESMQAVVNPADPNWGDDTLLLNPRVGSYSLTISGWRMWQVLTDAAGNVNGSSLINTATLLSSAVQTVNILNNQTTSVVYQFSVPGSGVINFARGTLSIDFSVQQGLPDGSACTSDIECASFVCAAAGTCAPASCADGVQNGAETSPDCGGGCACGGGTMACTAAEAAVCPDPATCTVTNGMISCGGMSGCPAGGCPAGTMCTTYADGSSQCVGGTTACTAAEAAGCPDPATCTVTNGMISCGAGMSSCPAGGCPAGTMCTTYADGSSQCVGGATACTAAQAAACPDPATCSFDPATGLVSCGTSTCDPMVATSCPAGLVCQLSGGQYTCL